MQIWIHDNKMKKIVALNNDIPDMMSYTNSSWHSYLDQATSTFDFTIPKFSNGELHEDLKLINDECFVSFYVNGSYQVFYIATLQEDDFNIQLTCNNTNLEYALEYANPFNSSSAQSIKWYLEHMDLLSFASVEIGNNEISDRKRTLTFDSQETKMARLQSLMSNFDAEFEFKVELNRDGTYKRIVINIYQEADDTHHGIGTDRKDVVLYYSNGLKGVQVSSDKTQIFNAGVFDGKNGVNLANVEFSEKNADGVEEFYSRKGDIFVYAPLSMQRYPATMKPNGQDNWIRKDFQTEYENVNDLKAYALRTLKQYAYPLVTYTASVQSGFVSHYTDLKLGDTIRIIDKNFVGGLALEARVSEMIISFDNPANNSFVFTNYRKLDNKPSSALQTRIEQVIESRLYYRIELATTGGVTFKNNEGETIIKPSLYKGNLPWTKDVTWHWTLNSIVTDGVQYRIQARDITDTAVLTVDAFVGGNKVATTEITLTNINDGLQGPQGPQGDEGPQGPQGDTGNGIANTVVTYGLSMSDTTEPATWSSSVPTLVKGMYLWTRTVIIYTNGESTTSYQISYIAKDADATAAIDKTKQELLEKLDTVRNDSLAAVDAAKQDLTNVTNELNTAKQDLTSHAQQLQTQANAQTELTRRVTAVETTANGTKTTVSELSKTVAQNGKDITSVTARTKVVEDDLTSTKTTLSQVKTTADSASQKTATLETGLNGLSAKFETLKIGSRNYFKDSKSRKYYIDDRDTQDVRTFIDDEFWQNDTRFIRDYVRMSFDIAFNPALPSDFTTNVHFSASPWYNCGGITFKGGTTALQHFDLKFNLSGAGNNYKTDNVFIRLHNTLPRNTAVSLENFNLYLSAVVEDYSSNEADIEQKVAEYKQTADQNYASLQSNLQTLDGTVKQNKSEFDQTASQIKSSISAVEGKTSELDGDITKLNTTLTQTANGLEQLSTQVTSQGSTITSHTSSINSLTTGLSAKVSQSDFNTLSGRVTTAENNIIAKANELSSKITSVEGKIPTDIGMVNLFKGSRDFSGSWTSNTGVYAEDYKGVKIFKTQAMWGGRSQYFEVKTGEEYVFSAYVKSSARTDGVNFYLVHESKQPMATGLVAFGSDNRQDHVNIGLTNEYKRIVIKIKITKDGWIAPRIERYNSDAYLFFGGYKLERGNIATNWAPASEDYDINLASLEGKIPTNLDSLNLMTGTRDWSTKANKWHMGANWSTESGEYQGLKVHSTKNGWNGSHQNIFVKNGDVITFSFFAKANSTLSNIKVSSRWTDSSVYQAPLAGVKESDEQITITSEWKRYSKTIHITSDGSLQFRTEYDGSTIPNGNTFYVAGLKLAKSSLDTGYSENPTDIASDITKLDTTLTQTADGLKQLSTKVTSQGGTITSHTNSINSLTTGLQAKVSQSDFNTLSGRVTTAENNITAKANELSSKISSVEGKLPSGEINLVEYGRPADGYSPYYGAEYTTHGFYYNSSFKMYIIRNTSTNEKIFGMNRFKVERNTDYTLYFKGFNNGRVTNMDVWFLKRVNGSKNDWDSAQALVSGRKFSVSRAEDVSVTFNTGNYDEGYLRFDNNGTTTAGTSADLYFGDVSVKKGKSNNGWSPSLAELASSQALKNAQSEFKQTTDAIKASVSSLDNSTVKSSSLTINADGIVMKAGKSTTDVANAIGSYFAVNQNAINLFSDKIKVKGNMIVSGSISSDKISSSGITANVIKGGTLQSVNGSTNFELNTGKLFYNNNNTGVFRVQNGASTMGLKFSNTPITVSGTSRILSRIILGGDRNETTLDDGKWDKGGFSGLVIETIKGAIPAANEHADSLRAISDTIYFTHTYSADSPTGVSAHGWKMETYAPDSSYSGNIVLKPYGINYRQSDIVVGDVRLDNGDGSGYWMRATINTLKACFGHILNGGTSSQALNAIRSELNKISGT